MLPESSLGLFTTFWGKRGHGAATLSSFAGLKYDEDHSQATHSGVNMWLRHTVFSLKQVLTCVTFNIDIALPGRGAEPFPLELCPPFTDYIVTDS